jgi:hypothetical protein
LTDYRSDLFAAIIHQSCGMTSGAFDCRLSAARITVEQFPQQHSPNFVHRRPNRPLARFQIQTSRPQQAPQQLR